MKLNHEQRTKIKNEIKQIPFDCHITLNFIFPYERKLKRYDVMDAHRTTESFMRSLSKQLFKTSYRRFNKHLQYTARIERAPSTGRLHAHILLIKPEHISRSFFEHHVRSIASKNRFITTREKRAILIQYPEEQDVFESVVFDPINNEIKRGKDADLYEYPVKHDVNQDDVRFIWGVRYWFQ